MAKKTKYEELKSSIIDLVGGKENISLFTHCVTRLRFNVKDKGLLKAEEIEKIPGVVACQWSGDQFQIIIGQNVAEVYKKICEANGLQQEDAIHENLDKKKFSLNAVFDAVSACIIPIIPVLIACGLMKVIMIIGAYTGLMVEGSNTYQILSIVGDAGFYFLPILVGYAAAKKFGANPAFGMLLGAILIHPSFVEMVASNTPMSIFGLPIPTVSYGSTIFPIILSVFIMSYVDKFVAKHSPDILRTVLVPLVTFLVMTPVTLCALAPLGYLLGSYVATGAVWFYNTFGALGIAIIGALYPLMVLTGLHSATGPAIFAVYSTYGYEPLFLPINVVSNFNQGIAAIAIALKSKNKDFKETAMSSGITTFISGASEPTLFGINLKTKTGLYASMIGNFAGCLVMGLLHVVVYSFGIVGIFCFPAFIGEKQNNLLFACIGIVVGWIVTFVCSYLMYKEEK